MTDASHLRHDIALLLAACPGLPFAQDPALMRQRSRDVFWFSPILNRVFRHMTAPGDPLGSKAPVDPHRLPNPGKMPSYVPAIP